MTFVEAVTSCIRNYGEFSGRARPSEYWWWRLFLVMALGVATTLSIQIDSPWPGIIVGLTLVIPTYAVEVRRLHDGGFSGWMTLLAAIPGGLLVILYLTIRPGDAGANRFGPPLGPDGTPMLEPIPRGDRTS